MMRKFLLAPLAGLALALSLAGCGLDDATLEAQVEKARIAIDAGDYAAAQATLEALCPVLAVCPDDILSLLAEAYMGQGGVDVLTFLEQVDLGSAPTTFDLLTGMLGTTDSATKLAELDDALAALAAIPARTADEEFQYAVASACHAAMAIVDATFDGTNYNAGAVDATLTATVVADLEVVLPSLDEVAAALLGGTSDATDELNAMVAELGGSANPDNTVTLTQGQLATFVGTL